MVIQEACKNIIAHEYHHRLVNNDKTSETNFKNVKTYNWLNNLEYTHIQEYYIIIKNDHADPFLPVC